MQARRFNIKDSPNKFWHVLLSFPHGQAEYVIIFIKPEQENLSYFFYNHDRKKRKDAEKNN
jgi:hypothetical protein